MLYRGGADRTAQTLADSLGAEAAREEGMPMTYLRPLVYVDSDIPAGLTIDAWRRDRRPKPTTNTRLRRLARRVGL